MVDILKTQLKTNAVKRVGPIKSVIQSDLVEDRGVWSSMWPLFRRVWHFDETPLTPHNIKNPILIIPFYLHYHRQSYYTKKSLNLFTISDFSVVTLCVCVTPGFLFVFVLNLSICSLCLSFQSSSAQVIDFIPILVLRDIKLSHN